MGLDKEYISEYLKEAIYFHMNEGEDFLVIIEEDTSLDTVEYFVRVAEDFTPATKIIFSRDGFLSTDVIQALAFKAVRKKEDIQRLDYEIIPCYNQSSVDISKLFVDSKIFYLIERND